MQRTFYWLVLVALAFVASVALNPPRLAYSKPLPQVQITGEVVSINGDVLKNIGVKFYDSVGHIDTVMTDTAGKYSFTAGPDRVAPYLIQGGSLFSYALDKGVVANVNGYTDLDINQICESLAGTNAATQALGTPKVITAEQLQVTIAVTNSALEVPLVSLKLAPTLNFNPFSAPPNKPLDVLLHASSFSGRGTAIENVNITAGFTSLTSTFMANWAPKSLWMLTDVTTPFGESKSTDFTLLPSAAGGLAYKGVNGLVLNFASIVNTRGKSLADSDFSPVYDPAYFDDSKDAALSRAFAATRFRGSKITPFLGPIYQFSPGVPDLGHNTIRINVRVPVTSGSKTSFVAFPQNFKCKSDGTNCLLYGDRSLADAYIDPFWYTLSANSSPPLQQGYLGAVATVWTGSEGGTISSGTVSDNTFFSNTNLPKLGQQTFQLMPTPTTTSNATFDVFGVGTVALPPFPDYNDSFGFALFFSIFGFDSYERHSVGYTTEPVHWLQPFPDGGHMIGDAKLGGSLNLKWQLPTSYIPRATYVFGNACSNAGGQNVTAAQPVAPNATSATLKFPKLVMGQPTNGANAFVETVGSLGQHSLYQFRFGTRCTF